VATQINIKISKTYIFYVGLKDIPEWPSTCVQSMSLGHLNRSLEGQLLYFTGVFVISRKYNVLDSRYWHYPKDARRSRVPRWTI